MKSRACFIFHETQCQCHALLPLSGLPPVKNRVLENTGFTALRPWRVTSTLNFARVRGIHMTPILIALIAVLPVGAAGLALLFVSGTGAQRTAARPEASLLNHLK
jgi:hypothetical protein